MIDDLVRVVLLSNADIARIDEICENPPPITEHMLAAIEHYAKPINTEKVER